MASEHAKVVLHRLYLTVFWVLLAVAVGVPGVYATVYVHDRVVVAQDFDCLEKEVAAEQKRILADPSTSSWKRVAKFVYSADVGAKCNVTQLGEYPLLYSTRAWDQVRAYQPPNNVPWTWWFWPVLATVPVAILVLGRWWLRWLTKPPPAPAA